MFEGPVTQFLYRSVERTLTLFQQICIHFKMCTVIKGSILTNEFSCAVCFYIRQHENSLFVAATHQVVTMTAFFSIIFIKNLTPTINRIGRSTKINTLDRTVPFDRACEDDFKRKNKIFNERVENRDQFFAISLQKQTRRFYKLTDRYIFLFFSRLICWLSHRRLFDRENSPSSSF